MVKRQFFFIGLIYLLLLVSCSNNEPPPASEEIGEPIVLLTSTVAARTVTPAAEPPTQTATVSASVTPAPPSTEESEPDSTATTRPTYTLTNTPMATSLPPTITPIPQVPPAITFTPASNAVVHYFRSNVTEANPGDTIRLEWATGGAAEVTLWTILRTGQFGEFWTVETSGLFDYTIHPRDRNWIMFALAVTDSAGITDMVTITVNLICPDEWFFTNHPDVCPQDAALVSTAAEQHFENGLMLWVQEEDRIYVLVEDGLSRYWTGYQDNWDPGDPEIDPALEPPPGFYQPVRGFGLVWREEPGVRYSLGWAVDEEAGYTTATQYTSYAKYNEIYIRALDGNIWRLKAERSGWEKILPY